MNKRRFVFIVVSVILCLSTSVPIFPQSQQMPQASPELVALSKIPLLNVMVTDPEGNKLSGAFVTYRSLTSGLNGGGTTGATGAERFNSYLPDDMRAMFNLKAEKNRLFLRPEAISMLSNDQLRRFMALTLDALALGAWMSLNGIEAANPWRPGDVRQDPARVIKSLEQLCNDERNKLKNAGALSADRLAASRAYIRRALGEGYLVREDPARDGVRLSGQNRMYAAALGGLYPHIVLQKGSVRIVAVDLP